MATCEVRQKAPPPPPKEYVLTLNDDELDLLCAFIGCAGGNRATVDRIHSALHEAGIYRGFYDRRTKYTGDFHIARDPADGA